MEISICINTPFEFWHIYFAHRNSVLVYQPLKYTIISHHILDSKYIVHVSVFERRNLGSQLRRYSQLAIVYTLTIDSKALIEHSNDQHYWASCLHSLTTSVRCVFASITGWQTDYFNELLLINNGSHIDLKIISLILHV